MVLCWKKDCGGLGRICLMAAGKDTWSATIRSGRRDPRGTACRGPGSWKLQADEERKMGESGLMFRTWARNLWKRILKECGSVACGLGSIWHENEWKSNPIRRQIGRAHV